MREITFHNENEIIRFNENNLLCFYRISVIWSITMKSLCVRWKDASCTLTGFLFLILWTHHELHLVCLMTGAWWQPAPVFIPAAIETTQPLWAVTLSAPQPGDSRRTPRCHVPSAGRFLSSIRFVHVIIIRIKRILSQPETIENKLALLDVKLSCVCLMFA